MNFYELDRVVSENAPVANPMDQMLAQINKAIDEWEEETKNNLMNSIQNAPKRGILSRLGGFAQNFVYGRNNQNNPQYYRNKFGDSLGMKDEAFDPLASEILSLVEETEKAVEEAFLVEWPKTGAMGQQAQRTQDFQSRMGMTGTMGKQAQKTANVQQQQGQQRPNLKIFNLISSAANSLRQKIKDLLQTPTNPAPAPTNPAPAPTNPAPAPTNPAPAPTNPAPAPTNQAAPNKRRGRQPKNTQPPAP